MMLLAPALVALAVAVGAVVAGLIGGGLLLYLGHWSWRASRTSGRRPRARQ